MLPTNRRSFLQTAAAAATVATMSHHLSAEEEKKYSLKKAVKYNMIDAGKTPKDKLELIKEIGFLGAEIESPSGINLKALKAASESTGMKIHGVIDSVHWHDTLSSPDEKMRAKGLAALKTALDDAAFIGADTVLLVPGVVKGDVTYEDCKTRSQEEIRKVLPQAEKLNVKIAIEVVWNNFITKPEQFVEYIDDFKSPFVGGYFDCSNMVKYGVPPADWIRALGKRMLKFDFKGYSKAKGWVEIGAGDEDWPEILKALGEIGYHGWATAEVHGGGEAQLRKVLALMDKVLGPS